MSFSGDRNEFICMENFYFDELMKILNYFHHRIGLPDNLYQFRRLPGR